MIDSFEHAPPPTHFCPTTPGSSTTGTAALLRSCHPWPVVAEFDVSREEALGRFEAHQQQLCYNMHARDVLKSQELQVTAAYLPFWLFDAVISVECKGALGFRPKG